ncbi:hypothetical protein LCGC14_1552950 [marine sediment metagenome]|uniref:Uncharacterized protein n=1 Tax=marine sediment metagenome TaxID=412755 RepID=A0A0F9IPR4_9ZZZZ
MGIGENKVIRATGAAAIATALTPPTTTAVLLVSVKLNLSATGGAAEDFTVTINSATDSVYDTIIFSQDMNTVQDLMWLPDQPIPVVNSDVVDFAYANSNSRTYGLEVIYRNA